MGNFSEVVRAKSKLRMALTGVSGSGKTLGALYIAYGITGDWKKIALIDTEHERARLYADREDLGTGTFLYCPMDPPYSADKYKNLVSEAAEIVGEDGVVIVDSFSHAWNNDGGVLDQKDRIAAQKGMNSYTAWNEAGRIQNNLVNTILAVDCHTIVTMRSKMDYVLEENDRGKKVPVKVGLAPVQRDDTEYEFDIVLDIARNHIATASKDVTFLDNYGEVITTELGEELKEWLNNGVDASEIKKEKEGRQPLAKEQIYEIFAASGNDQEICTAAYEAFGYSAAKEIQFKDLESIISKAVELASEKANKLAADIEQNEKEIEGAT